MGNAVYNLYEFGEFHLDAETGTLWRGSDLISLSPKSSELLRLLVRQEGRTVSKQEIFDTVWTGTFVEDGVLTQNIYTLRNALGRDEHGRHFIETVPRRGYRFAGHLRSAEKVDESEIVPAETPASPAAQPAFVAAQAATSSHRSNTYFLAGLGVLLLAAVGLGTYLYTRRPAENGEAAFAPIEQLKFQKVTDSGDVVFPTISPDGKMLAYVRLDEAESSVWVKQIGGGSPLRILPPTSKGYRSLVFSPDGQHLYFREDTETAPIYQTLSLGGPPKKVAENVWSDFSISPDGSRFAFIRRDSELAEHRLVLANVSGEGETTLAAKAAPWDYRSGAPAWSPDGLKLVVASGQQRRFFPKLLMIDTASGEETEIDIPRWRAIFRVLWMPDGERLLITAREANEPYSQIWMLALTDGGIRRLTNDLESYFWMSMTAEGKGLVTRQQRIVSHIWLLPGGDITRAKQLTQGERTLDGYAGLAWTPDDRIVFSSFANNVTDLHSINPDGAARVQLIQNAGQDNTDPSIAADGSSVVFTSTRTGSPQIWRMDIDGDNQRQLTFDEANKERSIAGTLSPDGREVYFIKLGGGAAAIWKMPIEGGPALKVSNLKDAAAESFVSVSPDGKWLAYRHVAKRSEVQNEERTIQVGVIASDGSGEPKIFDLPMRRSMVQWTRDSSAFYFSPGQFNESSIELQSLNDHTAKKIVDFPDRVFSFAWSPDGKSLAVARGRQMGDAILISNLP